MVMPPIDSPSPNSSGSSRKRPLPQSERNNQELLTGNEAFITGLSPSYWAHVPMHIMDLKSLTLTNEGINLFQNKFPISKCLLLGFIVNMQKRSDGSCMYVLDDGTGLIDCVSYSDSNDMYFLPNLLPDLFSQKPLFKLGDLVRIFGKIKNLALLQDNTVVRELQVKQMEHATRSNQLYSDPQVQHWMAIKKFSFTSPIESLQSLGTTIQSQVLNRQDLPSVDDTCGAWKVFGTSCTCSLPYKKSLLYCHCLAKVELLDPNFVFRDAFLKHLLQIQSSTRKLLAFSYRQIKDTLELANMAKQVVAHQDNPHLKVDRLFRNTFSALRKDGIIYLQDERDDVYILLSRELALQPFVQSRMTSPRENIASPSSGKRNFISWQGAPRWVSHVDKEKLFYIQRCILQNE